MGDSAGVGVGVVRGRVAGVGLGVGFEPADTVVPPESAMNELPHITAARTICFIKFMSAILQEIVESRKRDLPGPPRKLKPVMIR